MYQHPVQTQTLPIIVYHMQITLDSLYSFLINPCFPLHHGPKEGVLIFGFMISSELLCVHAFFG